MATIIIITYNCITVQYHIIKVKTFLILHWIQESASSMLSQAVAPAAGPDLAEPGALCRC